MVTAVQLVNPTTGRGANRVKANGLNNGRLESFWLLELLKFIGFLSGAAPYVLKNGAVKKKKKKGQKELRDRKIYVIQPRTVELQKLKQIMEQFREICWSTTAVKQDILAALRLTQILVKHREGELNSRRGLEDWEESPLVSIAQGFDVAFYKDMGSAHATMNVSTLNIPNWFPDVSTLQQVEKAEQLLKEHIRVIRRIQGEHGREGSEEFELLRTYRDFLSGHDLRPFWRFATRYGHYVFRQREQEKEFKKWLPQLTKKGLDFLVQQSQEQSLSEIINNRGFQQIASAIREATVKAQYRHSQENDHRYEIRYGLGQELLRKVRYRDDFMIALNKFLQLYNTETAREEEKEARKRKHRLEASDYREARLRYCVSTADVARFCTLFDHYPVELVATMLLSYSSCRWEPLAGDETEFDSHDDEPEIDAEDDGDDSADE